MVIATYNVSMRRKYAFGPFGLARPSARLFYLTAEITRQTHSGVSHPNTLLLLHHGFARSHEDQIMVHWPLAFRRWKTFLVSGVCPLAARVWQAAIGAQIMVHPLGECKSISVSTRWGARRPISSARCLEPVPLLPTSSARRWYLTTLLPTNSLTFCSFQRFLVSILLTPDDSDEHRASV